MSKTYVAIRDVVGSSCVDVLAVSDTLTHLTFAGGDCILEVWYAPLAYPTRPPVVGERLDTWVDVSTRYAIAPRKK